MNLKSLFDVVFLIFGAVSQLAITVAYLYCFYKALMTFEFTAKHTFTEYAVVAILLKLLMA